MPRLFYAVEVPQEIRDKLAPKALSLRDLGPHVRPVGRNSFHLTLLFLGDQPNEAVVEFCNIGRNAVQPAKPSKLEIGPVGTFPRVSFLTLTGELETLSMVSIVLKDSCMPYLENPDDRPFKPHVTLARHKNNIRPQEKEKIVSRFQDVQGMSWVVDELILFESELTPKGAIYTVIEKFPFGG